jgi:acyl-CoA hydrolase
MSAREQPMVPVDATNVEMTQIVLPSHTNNHGTVFGGQMAAWIDVCAAVSAQRFARKAVVTASIDELHFVHPVRRGMVIILRARVNQAWGSSLEVGVRVEAEDPRTGDTSHCCTAYLTFVAINDDGKPSQVPTLDAGKDQEALLRAREAQDRRDNRLSMRQKRRNMS